MAIRVAIDLEYEFAVRAGADQVFAVLSDVPRSASHFPKVERLTDLGDGAYKWEMQKVGTQQVNLQTVYACRYVSSMERGTVQWTPVDGIGNARVSGGWSIATRADASATDIRLAIEAEVDVPLPGLMKMLVVPVVESEFEGLVDRYIANLIATFGGEV